MRGGRDPRGEILEFGIADARGIGILDEHLMEIGQQSCVGVGSEEAHVQIEGGIEFEQHLDGQRTLIVLELIDIAHR
ncbi:Uncharacterised protein [Mycobacteroides abscessus subsp. abscessus]|nr:Uncharacterised protein [Mycobacteroides abscessus subsp. abscessus]